MTQNTNLFSRPFHTGKGILQRLFDILFPPSDEELLIRSLDSENTLRLSFVHRADDTTVLMNYAHESVRALIQEAKFHESKHAIAMLGVVLGSHLEKYEKKEQYVVIPIPLSRTRLRSRGYNQVSRILAAAAVGTDLTVAEKTLIRTRDTKPQTELPRNKRYQNVANAFGVRDPQKVGGRHIILIDDVVTTGATLRAARAALVLHHPASVTCVALAH